MSKAKKPAKTKKSPAKAAKKPKKPAKTPKTTGAKKSPAKAQKTVKTKKTPAKAQKTAKTKKSPAKAQKTVKKPAKTAKKTKKSAKTTKKQKPKVAFYWCASCGGCEEAVVDLSAALLDVAAAVDIVLWPVALDFKYSDVEKIKDGQITASFINGAIRTDEQREIVEMLRKKSKLVFAFGSCATDGGIPGLANLTSKQEINRTSYLESPTVVNPKGVIPGPKGKFHKQKALLPKLWDQVFALHQVIDVDYYIPGCAPTVSVISEAFTALLSGKLPKKGTRLTSNKALCDTCPHRETRSGTAKLDNVYLPHEIQADPERCLLEQGLLCCGPATRSGCGELCIRANMPCTGCFGPPPSVTDQGAKMLTAIASLFSGKTKREAEAIVARVLDPAGSFYRYSVPASLLSKKVMP